MIIDLGALPFAKPAFTSTGNPLFHGLGTILLAVGATQLDLILKMADASGNAKAASGLAYCVNFRDEPSTPTGASSYSGTPGATVFQRRDINAAESTPVYNMFLQPGVFLAMDGGSTPGIVSGSLRPVLRTTGRHIGDRVISLTPEADTSQIYYFEIGPFVPLLWATRFQVVIAGMNIASMAFRFYARTANDPTRPDSLEALGAGFTDFPPTDGIDIQNTDDDLSVTGLTNYATRGLVQLVLALRMKTGGSAPNGQFKVYAALASDTEP